MPNDSRSREDPRSGPHGLGPRTSSAPPACLSRDPPGADPGGRVVFVTPNSWNYNSWLIGMVPNAFHAAFTSRLYGRRAEDTYPTRYRLNSIRRLGETLPHLGYERERVILNGDPTYIAFNEPLFRYRDALGASLRSPVPEAGAGPHHRRVSDRHDGTPVMSRSSGSASITSGRTGTSANCAFARWKETGRSRSSHPTRRSSCRHESIRRTPRRCGRPTWRSRTGPASR